MRSLRELRLLDLRANRLTSVPDWIVELPRLEKLDLRWNEVYDVPRRFARARLRRAHRIGVARHEQWVYFIHAPRENFGATMTAEEQAVWGEHVRLLQRRSTRIADPRRPDARSDQHGHLRLRGTRRGAARAYMDEDPTISNGIAHGELREFRAAFLRGS